MKSRGNTFDFPLDTGHFITVNVTDLKVNDIENVNSYTIIVAFMSANKSAHNMRYSSLSQQSWASSNARFDLTRGSINSAPRF